MKQIMLSKLILIAAIALNFMACSISPRPINYGSDVCEFCKMKIMDPRFGAELVTDKGKVFVFDDINCMVLYKQDPQNQRCKYLYEMVMDYQNPRQLIDARNGVYFKSEAIKSPMASKTAAFADHAGYHAIFHQQIGEVFTWDEIDNVLE